MTLAELGASNRPRVSGVVTGSTQPYATPLTDSTTRVSNIERFVAASYEDLAVKWTDYSFDWAQEDFPPGLSE
jgi:hypothetical protein